MIAIEPMKIFIGPNKHILKQFGSLYWFITKIKEGWIIWNFLIFTTPNDGKKYTKSDKIWSTELLSCGDLIFLFSGKYDLRSYRFVGWPTFFYASGIFTAL